MLSSGRLEQLFEGDVAPLEKFHEADLVDGLDFFGGDFDADPAIDFGHVDAFVLQVGFELAFDGVVGLAARLAEEWFDAGDFAFAGHDVAPFVRATSLLCLAHCEAARVNSFAGQVF